MQGWLARVTPAEKIDHHERATLLASLEGNERGARWRAAQALGETDSGREGVNALVVALSSGDPILCWEAAHALAEIHTPAAEALLMEAAITGNAEVQVAAIDALGGLPASAELLAALRDALGSESAAVRQGAAEAVARLATQAPAEGVPAPGAEFMAVLLALLQSDDAPLVRRAAALALGRIGDSAARDALEASQEDKREDPLVRQMAGDALARLHQPKAAIEGPMLASATGNPIE